MTIYSRLFSPPNLLANHQDIAQLPSNIFPKVLPHLTIPEQCLLRRVSATWHNVSKTQAAIFPLIKSIATCQIGEVIQLVKDGIMFPFIQNRFNSERNKILNTYLSKALRAMFKLYHPMASFYFRSLSTPIKETIQFLDLSNTSINDLFLSIIICELPNLKKLYLKNSCVTGWSLTQINISKFEALKLNFDESYLSSFVTMPYLDATSLQHTFSQTVNLEELSLYCHALPGEVFQGLNPSNLKKLELSHFTALDENFLDFFRRINNVEELTLSNSSGEILSFLKLPNLRKLILYNVRNVKDQDLNQLFYNTQLVELHHNKVEVTEKAFLDFNPSHLEVLIVVECPQFKDIALQRILGENTALKDVFLKGLILTGKAFQNFNSSKLEALTIIDVDHDDEDPPIEDSDLHKILSNAKSLDYLLIQSAYKITANAFQGIALPKLVSLSIMECTQVSFNDPQFLAFLNTTHLRALTLHSSDITTVLFQKPTQLEYLEIAYCNVSKIPLHALLSNSPKLEVLILIQARAFAEAFQGFASSRVKTFQLSDKNNELDPNFLNNESFQEFFRKNKSLKVVDIPPELQGIYLRVKNELKGPLRLAPSIINI